MVGKGEEEVISLDNIADGMSEMRPDKKKDNNGKERDITKVKVKMRHSVREDLLRYLQSNIAEKEEKIG